jgi:hypothetical protein
MKSKIFFLVLLTGSFFISCSGREDYLDDDSQINNPGTFSNLIIEAPTFGEVLKPGSTYQIKWSFPSTIKKIQIRLYRKEELKSIIAIAYENNGAFNWTIPNNIINSVHYRIKIFNVDSPGFEAMSDYFYVLNQ